jgi:hypothetical protein
VNHSYFDCGMRWRLEGVLPGFCRELMLATFVGTLRMGRTAFLRAPIPNIGMRMESARHVIPIAPQERGAPGHIIVLVKVAAIRVS